MTSPAAAFRNELGKIMPGYSWTVRKAVRADRLEAIGIQSSGFNRLSTLFIVRTTADGRVTYSATSAGHGTRAPWEHTCSDGTLARALRGLQTHYEWLSTKNRGLAAALQSGRSGQP